MSLKIIFVVIIFFSNCIIVFFFKFDQPLNIFICIEVGIFSDFTKRKTSMKGKLIYYK